MGEREARVLERQREMVADMGEPLQNKRRRNRDGWRGIEGIQA